MGFGEAIKTCFMKYACFEGRACRSEYWFWFLFNVIVFLPFSVIAFILGFMAAFDNRYLTYLFILYGIEMLISLGLLIPNLAVGSRRLHDAGYSALLLLLYLVPFVGGIPVLIFCAVETQKGTNQYGPNPFETQSEEENELAA